MPNVPCIKAKIIETTAIVICNLKGIFPTPFMIRKPINAVIKKDSNVIMPKYIINGLPNIKK
jgi:hypothetical protein